MAPNYVSGRYFPAAGIPILQGRGFDENSAGQDVAVVSRALADRLWPSGGAVGKRFRMPGVRWLNDGDWLTVYAVVAYETSARTREIGVRVALGASRGAVIRHVLGRSVLQSVAGTVLGLLGAVALSRLLAPLLYGIAPTDPATFAAAAILLLAAAVAGAWLPARRAAATEPMTALRTE